MRAGEISHHGQQTFGHSDVWVKGFDALGMAMVPAPLAINSVEFKGRPACIYDGWCNAGCPTGALANPLVTYLAEAIYPSNRIVVQYAENGLFLLAAYREDGAERSA